MKMALDEFEKATRTMNRHVDGLAVRMADQPAAFRERRTEGAAMLSDLRTLHQRKPGCSWTHIAPLNNVADRVEAIRGTLTSTA